MVPYQTFDFERFRRIGVESDERTAHIEAVTVIQGKEVTQVNPDGVDQFLAPNGRSLSHRGTCVCLTFFTEDAERFYITYQFHKGRVLSMVSEVEPNPDGSDIPELWRD